MVTLFVQANLYPRILAAMKPGATLGLSHGFLLGVLKNDGVDFRDDINVILVAPKVLYSQLASLLKSMNDNAGALGTKNIFGVLHACEVQYDRCLLTCWQNETFSDHRSLQQQVCCMCKTAPACQVLHSPATEETAP